MSNFIPMVSSSPPPMDDGGFNWEDDDDDFGTFTGADDSSYSFQSAPDTGGQPPKNQDNSISHDVTEKKDSGTWHQSNGQIIQEPKECSDDSFAAFPEDQNPGETNDTNEILDTRPSRIGIDTDLVNKLDDTINEEIIGDSKGPLTDSGLYSADISPVQNCENVHDSIKGQCGSYGLGLSSSDSSPVMLDADKCTNETNLKTANENDEHNALQCEIESKTQGNDESGQHKHSENCDIKKSSCTSLENLDATGPDIFSKVSDDSSHVDNDQCDNNIPIHENTCTYTSLVTGDVQETSAQSPQQSDLREETDLSETELTNECAVTDNCDNKDSCNQNDVLSCPELDKNVSKDSDLRNSNDLNILPDQAVGTDSISNSISEEVNSAASDEDFDEFESTDVEQAPLSESKEDVDIATKNEMADDNADSSSTTGKDSNIQETDDFGDFDTTTNVNKSEGDLCEEKDSVCRGQIPINDSSDVKEFDGDLKQESSGTSESRFNEDGYSDKNNSSGQSDNDFAHSSAIKSSDCSNSENEEKKDENCPSSGGDGEDDFGDFNEQNSENEEKEDENCPSSGGGGEDDFGDFKEAVASTDLNMTDTCDTNSAENFGNFKDPDGNLNEDDEFGKFNEADDFGAFDTAEKEFAAFGDSSEVANVGEVSAATNDWASFSEPQIVTAAETPAEEDDDEWAAFNDEPAQAPASPPSSSKAMSQKMSQQEKLMFAMTTVFPSIQTDGGSYIQVTDLDSLVAERERLQGEVSVWFQIKGIHSTNAVTYQYTKSHWNDHLFNTLHVDTRNVLIGHKKAPVPIFASGLTLLEPTKGTSATLKPDVLVDTSKTLDAVPQPQEAIPPAQFDWSSSGLKNPLEADNKTLNLDFLIQDQTVKSNALETEFLGSENFVAPVKPSMQPLENILANMKSVSTLRPINHPENISRETLKIVDSLPSLSFMKSKVLMFPLKLDQ